jgi:hypothetical protein
MQIKLSKNNAFIHFVCCICGNDFKDVPLWNAFVDGVIMVLFVKSVELDEKFEI